MPIDTASQNALELDQVFQALESLKGSEERFNEMKAQCRALASTWLLATFGAMGFLLTQTLHAGLATEVVVLAIGLACAVGLILLWVLDLPVYHRLLDASFTEALKLEARYPLVPQVRHRMIASQPGGQSLFYEEWFYLGGVAAPVVFSGTLFVRWCVGLSLVGGVVAAVTLLAGLGGAMVCMRRMSPNPAVAEASRR
jgi:hypothetical protein